MNRFARRFLSPFRPRAAARLAAAALLAALPDLRAAQPAIPGAPVSVLVPSLERLLRSGGRLVPKDDDEPGSALGPRTYFLPPEQATSDELGGTFSFVAAGLHGREAGSLAFGLSATPADGLLFATVARPEDPERSLYATNPPPPPHPTRRPPSA